MYKLLLESKTTPWVISNRPAPHAMIHQAGKEKWFHPGSSHGASALEADMNAAGGSDGSVERAMLGVLHGRKTHSNRDSVSLATCENAVHQTGECQAQLSFVDRPHLGKLHHNIFEGSRSSGQHDIHATITCTPEHGSRCARNVRAIGPTL